MAAVAVVALVAEVVGGVIVAVMVAAAVEVEDVVVI